MAQVTSMRSTVDIVLEPFYRKLDDKGIRIYWYVYNGSDHGGIRVDDIAALNFYCETSITREEFFEMFAERFYDYGDYWFVPERITRAFNNGMSLTNITYNSFVRMRECGIDTENWPDLFATGEHDNFIEKYNEEHGQGNPVSTTQTAYTGKHTSPTPSAKPEGFNTESEEQINTFEEAGKNTTLANEWVDGLINNFPYDVDLKEAEKFKAEYAVIAYDNDFLRETCENAVEHVTQMNGFINFYKYMEDTIMNR